MLGKSVVAAGLLAALLCTLVFAAGALAAGGGNSANAKLCQKEGWRTLMDSSTSQFANAGECVSYGAHGGAIYALARIEVELCATQPFNGICVSTTGFGLKPTTLVATPLLKNGAAVTTEFLIVQADGTVGGPAVRALRSALRCGQRLLGGGHGHVGRLAEHADGPRGHGHFEHRHAHVRLPVAVER
jgi:hypothetical protein